MGLDGIPGQDGIDGIAGPPGIVTTPNGTVVKGENGGKGDKGDIGKPGPVGPQVDEMLLKIKNTSLDSEACIAEFPFMLVAQTISYCSYKQILCVCIYKMYSNFCILCITRVRYLHKSTFLSPVQMAYREFPVLKVKWVHQEQL